MPKEQWRPFGDCDNCGSEAEVLTRSGDDETAYDGDEARCTECKSLGAIAIDDGGTDGETPCAYIDWYYDDEPEEE